MRQLSEMDVWSLPGEVEYSGDDIAGYTVRAVDGTIGTVIKATAEPGRAYLVLRARPWLGAGMVMLPAGLVDRLDHRRRVIAMALTRGDVARAPAFVADRYQDGAYLAELEQHYAR